MARKRGKAKHQFDTRFSKYKHQEDKLEIEAEDHQIIDDGAPIQNVDSDDEMFYTGQTSTEIEWERWLKEPQAPKVGRSTSVLASYAI